MNLACPCLLCHYSKEPRNGENLNVYQLPCGYAQRKTVQSLKKKRNSVIFNKMEGTEDYYVKWNKSGIVKQVLHDVAHK